MGRYSRFSDESQHFHSITGGFYCYTIAVITKASKHLSKFHHPPALAVLQIPWASGQKHCHLLQVWELLSRSPQLLKKSPFIPVFFCSHNASAQFLLSHWFLHSHLAVFRPLRPLFPCCSHVIVHGHQFLVSLFQLVLLSFANMQTLLSCFLHGQGSHTLLLSARYGHHYFYPVSTCSLAS